MKQKNSHMPFRKSHLLLMLLVCALTIACTDDGRKRYGREMFITPKGKKVFITPIKHASLQIQYDGYEFEIDPVSSAVKPIVDYTDKPQADVILVTNDHHDHFDMNAIFILTRRNTAVFLPQRCFNRYQRGTVIRNGEQYDLGNGIRLYAVPAYYRSAAKRALHPKGIGNGYILDLDGFRIYIAGDTELVPELRAIKNIDVAFLSCDTLKNMAPAQFRQALKMIRPKVLYPYQTHRTTERQIRIATYGLGIDVRIRELQ